MDVFGDKQYEEMDWFTKTVEPITYSYHAIIASLPAETELSFDEIISHVRTDMHASSLDVLSVASKLLANKGHWLTYSGMEDLSKFFILKIEGEPVLSLKTREITGGSVKLVKIKDAFTEDELKARMGLLGIDSINSIEKSKADMTRMAELLDLMGSTEGLKKRSVSGRKYELKAIYQQIMSNNTWNIRDVDLSNKVGLWIKQYVEDGNLAAMANFCKLKMITHRGYPIYSIEEE